MTSTETVQIPTPVRDRNKRRLAEIASVRQQGTADLKESLKSVPKDKVYEQLVADGVDVRKSDSKASMVADLDHVIWSKTPMYEEQRALESEVYREDAARRLAEGAKDRDLRTEETKQAFSEVIDKHYGNGQRLLLAAVQHIEQSTKDALNRELRGMATGEFFEGPLDALQALVARVTKDLLQPWNFEVTSRSTSVLGNLEKDVTRAAQAEWLAWAQSILDV